MPFMNGTGVRLAKEKHQVYGCYSLHIQYLLRKNSQILKSNGKNTNHGGDGGYGGGFVGDTKPTLNVSRNQAHNSTVSTTN